MKKNILFFLILALIASFFASCATSPSQDADKAAAEVAAEVEDKADEATASPEEAAVEVVAEVADKADDAAASAEEAAAEVVAEVADKADDAAASPEEATVEVDAEAEDKADEASAGDDQAKADEAAALIDAIYVQKWTEETDAQVAAAKEAWDALTEEQKELVEGESADPDYFGRDTGDASLDDPLNQDEIGENEILAVSFGTSFNDSRVADIHSVEMALQAAFPDWSVRRAFTAQIIINHVHARDGEKIDNVAQALDRAIANGVKNLVVQPTHLMRGAEFDELSETVESYRDQFETVVIAQPLLGETGADASSVNGDKLIVAEAITAAAVESAGYATLEEAAADSVAFVFMGHGTSHTAAISYEQMQSQFGKLVYENVFVGTVEGEPESTAVEEVIKAVKDAGYKKVILRPLMLVAGDHANNDMAGDDEDSWKTLFLASGEFESIDTQIEGLGRIPAIQAQYVAHTLAALTEANLMENLTAAIAAESDAKDDVLADGVYSVDFNSDSSMFQVNEALDGKGTLTVEDGSMTLHISLRSKKIVNLFLGLAEDAKKDGAKLIEPTTDKITHKDGKTEEVYGFDVPVPGIGVDFDLALIGTKGVWYDHVVSISNPEVME